MTRYNNFLNGEDGIEIEELSDAVELLEVCAENNISIYGVFASDYEHEPYWYVDNNELMMTRYFSDMADECCQTWTYKDFVANNS